MGRSPERASGQSYLSLNVTLRTGVVKEKGRIAAPGKPSIFFTEGSNRRTDTVLSKWIYLWSVREARLALAPPATPAHLGVLRFEQCMVILRI
jgi:hypothetical protein